MNVKRLGVVKFGSRVVVFDVLVRGQLAELINL